MFPNSGFIDDVYGANTNNGASTGDPMDTNGHGTFVAGVVGAVGNNGIGVTGIQQAASLILCRLVQVVNSENGLLTVYPALTPLIMHECSSVAKPWPSKAEVTGSNATTSTCFYFATVVENSVSKNLHRLGHLLPVLDFP